MFITRMSDDGGMTSPSLAVAIYARFSQNPDDRSESTRTQLKKGRQEAAQRWPGCTVREYSDDDYSGTLDEDQRPGYGRLMADIRRGLHQVVLAKDQSRIARDTQIWDRFRITCLTAGIGELSTWTQGDVSHVAGKSLPGRMMALMDAEYVEKTRLAVLDALEVYALEGRPPGGTCLGYVRQQLPVTINGTTQTINTLVPDPEWAPLIQRAFTDVLAGVPMLTIAQRWEEAKLPTARGGSQWRPSNIRRLLISPTLTGLRVRVPKATRARLKAEGVHTITLAVAQKHGTVTEGVWEPIIERATFLAVQKLLSTPTTVQGSDGRVCRRGIRRGPTAKYLWSGFFRCPKCQATMTGSKRGHGDPLYVCHESNGGCNGTGIIMPEADREAERQYLAHLQDAGYREALALEDPHTARRLELAERLDAIDRRRDRDEEDELTGQMSRDTFLRRQRKAEALKATLEAELLAIPEPIGDVDPDLILAVWDEATTQERRQMMALTVDYVQIHTATLFGGIFDPTRITVVMRSYGSSLGSVA